LRRRNDGNPISRRHPGLPSYDRQKATREYNCHFRWTCPSCSSRHKRLQRYRFFSIFKRGLVGVYQHCGEQHLQRYLTEFDFRYSNRAKLGVSDRERADKALKGIVGKRLTYRRTDGGKAPSLG
jgi:ISXO2 transposase-like protein